MKKVRTRIAPSPTGDPHVGTIYMALFNLIFAKHYGGDFILRIEDTDQTRSRKQYEDSIYASLNWSKIHWDEGPDKGGPFGPYRQSERTEIYQKYAKQLVDAGKAYHCFATSEELKQMREVAAATGQRTSYDRRYRDLSKAEVEARMKEGQSYTIRLKVPLTGTCVVEDMIKGKIETPWADIDDQVLIKSDGFPTYHLANVVDDHLMEISHIIRGDEWLSSTPKHALLYDSFGWERPAFMHMPLLLGSDGKKLSKRKNPTSAFFYRDSGYLPDAFLNFLSLMGYSMEGDKEIYTLNEIIAEFNPKKVGSSGAFFDVKKLDWINQQYLMNQVSVDQLWDSIRNWGFSDEKMAQLMPLVHTRIKTFGEFIELCDFLFINHIPLNETLLCPKNITKETAAMLAMCMIWSMEKQEDFGKHGFENATHEVAKAFGLNHKKVVMKLAFATITGKHQGPPLFDSVGILGKEKTRARFLKTIEFLGGISNKKMHLLTKAWEQRDCSALAVKNEPA